MLQKLIILLIISLSTFNVSIAQEEAVNNQLGQELILHKKIGVGKQLKLAKKLESQGSYVNSVKYYEKAQLKKPTNKCILEKLAKLNYKLRDYEASEKWYKKLIELDKDYVDDAQLLFARSKKYNAKYDEAIKEFKIAKEASKDDKFKKMIMNEIAGCDSAINKTFAQSKDIKVDHQKVINGNLQEFAPKIIDKNKILYSGLKSDTALNLSRLRTKKDYYTKLFFSSKDGENWSESQALPESINVPDAHVGNGYMTDNNQTLYYTICKEGSTLNMECKIHRAKKESDGWKTEAIKSLNLLGNTNTQPSIMETKDGKKYLMFVSDREGGKGEMDIYHAEMNSDGSIGKAVNAGFVNTSRSELTPHYNTKEGRLYFSSEGHPSIGGFDVFYVTGEPGNWGTIVNAGSPINSSVDDIYFATNDKGNGYITSNREGSISPRGKTCCDDIWAINLDLHLWIKCNFADNKDPEKKPLPGVAVSLYNDKAELIKSTVTNASDAVVFEIEPGPTYKMNGMKDGYFPFVETFTTPKEITQNDTIEKTCFLEPIIKSKYVIEPIYFAFDKSDVREGYNPILDSVLNILAQFPLLYLKIEGHTDSRGTVAYNQALSERRCKAAAEYCVKKGLAMDRIIMKGFSELVPLVSNTNEDGTDNPTNRDKNRRVDFKILMESSKDPGIDIEYKVTDPKPWLEKERGIYDPKRIEKKDPDDKTIYK
jgi:outer membrane protein OmpA-like peptidoglycan-associated protein/tetratricopeptide (TPR) repeat protein